MNFLYDFTLFVLDIHQNRSISAFLTPFDHFRPTLAEKCIPDLRVRPMKITTSIREEAEMVAVQKRVYNALATDLEAQRARSLSLSSSPSSSTSLSSFSLLSSSYF